MPIPCQMRQQSSRRERGDDFRREFLWRRAFFFLAHPDEQRRRNARCVLRVPLVLLFQFVKPSGQKKHVQQARGGKVGLRQLGGLAFQHAICHLANLLRFPKPGGRVRAEHAAPEISRPIRACLPTERRVEGKHRFIAREQVALLHQVPDKSGVVRITRQRLFKAIECRQRPPLPVVGFSNRRQNFRVPRIGAERALQMSAGAAKGNLRLDVPSSAQHIRLRKFQIIYAQQIFDDLGRVKPLQRVNQPLRQRRLIRAHQPPDQVDNFLILFGIKACMHAHIASFRPFANRTRLGAPSKKISRRGNLLSPAAQVYVIWFRTVGLRRRPGRERCRRGHSASRRWRRCRCPRPGAPSERRRCPPAHPPGTRA